MEQLQWILMNKKYIVLKQWFKASSLQFISYKLYAKLSL